MANVSSAASAPSTPIRAITSKLSTKSTPSIPPADQAYEPLVKALFASRLRTVLGTSAVAVWLLVNTWRYLELGFPFSISAFTSSIGFWSILYSVLQWALVSLPVLVLHKLFLTDKKTSATSPYTIVKAAFKQTSTRMALFIYILSGFAALLIHVAMAYTFERDARGDPKLTLFVKSKKHPYYFNGRLVFLAFVQLATAFTFALRSAMTDRFAYQWSHSANFKPTSKILIGTTASLVSLIFATISVASASLLFVVCRFALPILFLIPPFGFFLRPFVAHFLRGSWSLYLFLSHFPLLIRGWALAYTTLATWEVVDCLFDNIVSETASVSQQAADANLAIVSGVTSSNRIYKLFAYSEIRALATDTSNAASTRRMAFFGDQKGSLDLWGIFIRESLIQLGQDYQVFLRRGKPAPPPLLVAAPPKSASATPVFGTPTPILRTSIFRSAKESPAQAALDALASDGPLAQAVDAGAEATHVPELFRSAEAKVFSTPLAEETRKNVTQVRSVGSNIRASIVNFISSTFNHYAPPPLKDTVESTTSWWSKDRMDKAVDACLPYKELDVVIVEALSQLVCASLTEDRYGVVQRDIPRILEAMISFLIAIEEYQAEIASLRRTAPSSKLSQKEEAKLLALEEEIEKAQTTLGVAADGLKDGVGNIVRTFGEKLSAFRFPPRIAHKLQLFLEYS